MILLGRRIEEWGLEKDNWRSSALPLAPHHPLGSPLFNCPPGADGPQMHSSSHSISNSQCQPCDITCPSYTSSPIRFNIVKTKHVFFPPKPSCLYSALSLPSPLQLTTPTPPLSCELIIQELTDNSSLLFLHLSIVSGFFPQDIQNSALSLLLQQRSYAQNIILCASTDYLAPTHWSLQHH